MPLTSTETGLIIGFALLVLVVFALLFFTLMRARRRAKQLTGEIAESRERTEDQATNQLRLAAQEAKILEAEGLDVALPRRRIAEAEAAIGRRDPYHALQLARSAHDALIEMRRSGRAPSSSGGRGPVLAGARVPGTSAPGPFDRPTLSVDDPGVPIEGAEPSDAAPAPPRSSVPKNRMESHFQIGLLAEELAAAVRDRPDEEAVRSANRLAAEARTAERSGDYTEALRIALRARRALGGRVESLPATRSTAGAASPTSPIDLSSGPAGRADGSAGVGTCPRCGRPARATDQFCRSCGAPRSSARCPRCHTELEPGDGFCGVCGSPVGSG